MLPISLPARRALGARAALAALVACGVAGTLLAAPAPLHAQATPRVKAKPKVRVDMRRHDHDDEDGGGAARIDTTVAIDPRGTVSLELIGGDVVVRAWERNEVKILATAEDGRIALDASPLRVSLDVTHPGHDVRYEVTVPRTARLAVSAADAEIDVSGVRGGTDLQNASGDATLADVGGIVRVELMSGELHVSRADGDFRLELASGDIALDDVAGRVVAETVSGDIDVRGGRARELRLETTSGSLSYEGTIAADGQYELVTHSGDVTLRLPEGSSARLAAETYNGEFESDFPVVMQPTGGTTGNRPGTRQRRYTLQLGEGGGPLIRLESFSGDIHLVRALARTTPSR